MEDNVFNIREEVIEWDKEAFRGRCVDRLFVFLQSLTSLKRSMYHADEV